MVSMKSTFAFCVDEHKQNGNVYSQMYIDSVHTDGQTRIEFNFDFGFDDWRPIMVVWAGRGGDVVEVDQTVLHHAVFPLFLSFEFVLHFFKFVLHSYSLCIYAERGGTLGLSVVRKEGSKGGSMSSGAVENVCVQKCCLKNL